MPANPYPEFWRSVKELVANAPENIPTLARLVEAETDPAHNLTERNLRRWLERELPPESIGSLIALLEVTGRELVIVPKDRTEPH